MLDLKDKTKCCGCGACANICPKQCISMQTDEEGFLYPYIEQSQCVNCGKCNLVCSFRLNQKQRKINAGKYLDYKEGQFETPITYAVKHQTLAIRMASRSGGMFTALSNETLKNGGSVYGCVLNEEFLAVHIRADNVSARDKMRGSKYIQSNISCIFPLVKEDLQNDKHVLFSGTSCQIAGLKKYLGRDYPKLLCVDIVCHGVPSSIVWKSYLSYMETKHKSPVKAAEFRNKKDFGWKSHVETLFFENGNKISSKIFTSLFYSHIFLRPSCYCCPYKDIIHPGDITLADYWGIDKAAPGFNDDKGVSLVLLNNKKGTNAFDIVKGKIVFYPTRIEESLQPPLLHPFNAPLDRKIMWVLFYKTNFSNFMKFYYMREFIKRIKNKIHRVVNKFSNFHINH